MYFTSAIDVKQWPEQNVYTVDYTRTGELVGSKILNDPFEKCSRTATRLKRLGFGACVACLYRRLSVSYWCPSAKTKCRNPMVLLFHLDGHKPSGGPDNTVVLRQRPFPAGSGGVRTDRVHGAHHAVGSRRREHGTRGTARGVQLGEVGRRPGNGVLRVVQPRRDMCKRIEHFSRVLQRPGLRLVRRPRVASHRRHRNVASRE